MSSLKMTFSLASLILILGLVFVTAPAMAAIDVTVSISTSTNLAKDGYLIVRNNDDTQLGSLSSGASSVLVTPTTPLPDLEELFFEDGGTILLQGAKTTFDKDEDPIEVEGIDRRFDHDGKGDTDPVDLDSGDLVITEIMWGLDNRLTTNAPVNPGAVSQWIEIHNTSGQIIPSAVLNGVTLKFKSGRPAPADTDTPAKDKDADATPPVASAVPGITVLDRISNVVGTGWGAGLPGQSGRSLAGNDNNVANRVDFISAYRNREKLGKNDGENKDHWMASSNIYLAGYKGTPAAKERTGPKSVKTTEIPRSPIIFNEIANRDDENKKYEWIELRNVSDGEVNLKNWQISILTAVDSDKEFFNFFDEDRKVAAGGILLLVVSDPSDNPDHPLAAGFNVQKGADDQANGVNKDHSPHYLIMKAAAKDENDQRGLRQAGGLPDTGSFVLILRNGLDKEATADKVIDIAGATDAAVVKNTADISTSLWPFQNFGAPWKHDNQLKKDTVRQRAKPDKDGAYGEKDEAGKTAFSNAGWTGIGYKRNATASATHGGTPGYPNGALVAKDAAATEPVVISEIMFERGRSYSQWIELHNTSKTVGVDLAKWRIDIVNHNNADEAGAEYVGKLTEQIKLSGKLPPLQTYLIVSRRGSQNTKLPSARIISAGKKRAEPMLNPYGFQVTLTADDGKQTVDTVGNLGDKPKDSRRADAQSFEKLAWDLPAGTNDEGNRVSITRRPGVAANMMTNAAGRITGTMKQAWISFEDADNQASLGTYYGHSSDVGSPGYTTGGVLPVSLSKFRPERLDDGSIVIRWITESELNNAGFNILRSETRDGQFTKINTSLIAGQGTTSERTSYSLVDKSAKPNVVYYYQIQDVSLDGEVQTLRQSRLKGDVSPAGKLTTIWGEIKALQ